VLKYLTSEAIIRFSLAFILFFFSAEIISESTFTAIYGVSSYSILNFDTWTFPLTSSNEAFKYLIGTGSVVAGVLLIIGKFTKFIGATMAAIFTVGLLTTPGLFFNPFISIFKSSLNITLAGSALSLALKKENKPISKAIIRVTLGTSILLIFISSFTWINENNLIWSYYIDSVSQQITALSIPVVASILGSTATLLVLGILKRTAATILGGLFIIIIIIHGLSSYVFIGITGSCLSLLAQSSPQKNTQKERKKDRKRKNKKN